MRTLAEAVGAEPVDGEAAEARTPDGRLSVCVASQDEPLAIY